MSVSRGKIQGKMDPLVCEYVTTPELEKELKRSYQTFLDINKAHVLMLVRKGIISDAAATSILDVTQRMAKMGDTPTFEYDYGLEDIYPNLEKYLIDQVGIEIGGQQHTARSRNDLTVTQERIDARRMYLEVCALYNKLRQTIVRLAKENLETFFAGYTCLQPSEPISMGHYWSAVLNAMDRDYDRIQACWKYLNINPLGGCSMGSTSYDIDRWMTSELLGFDEPMDNSLDCVAGLDYMLALASSFSIASNTFSRLCTDLYTWSTPEFGYVEVGDSVAACSSIMPQKKNPVTLEYVRGSAANVEALYMAMWGAMKNTPYTLVVDTYTVAANNLWPLFEAFEGQIKILDLTLNTLTFNKERMFKFASENFCAVTELANRMVQMDGISFRAAHEIVAATVAQAIHDGKNSAQITSEMINQSFQQLFGMKSSLTDDDIKDAMNPERIARSKKIIGGTSPEEVTRQLERIQEYLQQDEELLKNRCAQISDAKQKLETEVQSFLVSY
jgi:argininosuccinate lyase